MSAVAQEIQKPVRAAKTSQMPALDLDLGRQELQLAPPMQNPLLGMLGQLATSPNFNPEAFRMIVDLLREEKAEAARNEFREAFAAFQKDAPAVQKKGDGHNTKYARLEDVIDAVRPTLSQNGFSLHHTIKQDDGKITVRAVLGHRAGHAETTEIVLPIDTGPGRNAVQAHMSSVSYGRRYTSLALLGIAPEGEDDDGKAAGSAAQINEEQLATIQQLIVDTDTQIARFTKVYKIAEVKDLPASKYEEAVKLLKKKLEQSL